jgi:hypothetical protein
VVHREIAVAWGEIRHLPAPILKVPLHRLFQHESGTIGTDNDVPLAGSSHGAPLCVVNAKITSMDVPNFAANS